MDTYRKTMNEKDNTRRYLTLGNLGTSLLFGVLGFFGSGYFLIRSNYIPKVDEVQNGFVVPNKLEIKLDDLDENGQKETYAIYNRKRYAFIVDGPNSRPCLQEFNIPKAQTPPIENVEKNK